MFTRVKAAAISFKPKKWDKAGNADRLEEFFRRAARQKPDVIVAPEGMLEGYVVTDVTWHRERAEAFHDLAEPLDGPYIHRFCKLARSLRTCLCFGFAERIGRDCFNSAVFIDHRGHICGTYHKVTETTHRTWNFARQASQVRAFDTPLGRCGIVICSDRWMPLLSRTLVLDGARFLLIPTYGSKEHTQTKAVLARARENGVPIVQANVGMTQIISKGEIVAYKWGLDQWITGFIHIPVAPSKAAVRACDRELQSFQPKMQRDQYRAAIKMMRKGKPSRDVRKSFVSESTFRRLQKTDWGARP
jgi:predicted amidohydrolase